MSLLPLLLNDKWMPGVNRREVEHGLVDDLLQPLAVFDSLLRIPELLKDMRDLNTDLQHQTASSVTLKKNGFQANFDVQHFKPEEITVKVNDDTVTVEAKHEEKPDEHGQIYRHFIRKYKLPKNCDVNRLESKLSSDGVLSISAPAAGDKLENRCIPITRTGKPARSLEEKYEKPPKKCKI